jgi:transposase-like protein
MNIQAREQYMETLRETYLELKKTWDNRKLDSKYYAVYIDALHMNIRRSSSVDNEALYIAVGLKLDLTREILGIYSIPEESASGWKEVVQDLKKRGMKQAISFVADGLKGLDSVIREEYPDSLFQRCIVHLKRSIGYRIRPADRAEIMIDLKMVFNLDDVLDTKELAMERLQLFINKWKRDMFS